MAVFSKKNSREFCMQKKMKKIQCSYNIMSKVAL